MERKPVQVGGLPIRPARVSLPSPTENKRRAPSGLGYMRDHQPVVRGCLFLWPSKKKLK